MDWGQKWRNRETTNKNQKKINEKYEIMKMAEQEEGDTEIEKEKCEEREEGKDSHRKCKRR